MKHLKNTIVVAGLFTSLLTGTQVDASSNINVQISGQSLYFDQPPVMENNRVLVPMRTIFEVVGAEVNWVAEKSTVKAQKGDLSIILPLNQKEATINGTSRQLDVPAKSVNGRTLVPLRFVSEALGCKVDWLANQSLVKITFDGEIKEQTGKVYPDGWVAPILKSAWSPDQMKNYETLKNELGFTEGGRIYGVKYAPHAVVVNNQSGDVDVDIKFFGWQDSNVPDSYRIPVVAKELFKLYFGNDATRVWNYVNSGNIPDEFTANGRTCKASVFEGDGSLNLQVGIKK